MPRLEVNMSGIK